MITIDLFDGFFVEIDELNHTLKQNYIGKDKEGNEKQAQRVIGYYTNLRDAVERFIQLDVLEKNDGRLITLLEYANAIEDIFEQVKDISPLKVKEN